MLTIPPFELSKATFTPILRADTHIDRIDAEGVAWHPQSRNPTYLDPVALLLTDVFDGTASVEELVEDVHVGIGVDHEVARAQILRVLGKLAAGGLLEVATDDGVEVELPLGDLPDPDW